MSFKKKPRVYEILRTPEVWEKVILCTNDFSSCRFSASSFFADDIRVIPPLVLNKLCKLQEPSLLPLHFLRVYIQRVFAEIYFLEKKDVISCSTSSLRCATALALLLNRGYFAYRILSHMYLYDRDIFRLFDTSSKLMEETFVSITARWEWFLVNKKRRAR